MTERLGDEKLITDPAFTMISTQVPSLIGNGVAAWNVSIAKQRQGQNYSSFTKTALPIVVVSHDTPQWRTVRFTKAS